jgi:tryptophan synthase
LIDLYSLSYVPLIAPSTSESRMKALVSIADSFIYVVSKMATTGSTAGGSVSASLPDLINRIRQYTSAPLAVGFGVATRDHFETVAASGADGVVIGSRLVNVIGETEGGDKERAQAVEGYCREISLKGQEPPASNGSGPSRGPTQAQLDNLASTAEAEMSEKIPSATDSMPSRFGEFGGQYVPEALVDCLLELEEAHKKALADPTFWEEFEGLYGYMNRPSQLYKAERLTEKAGGAQIWLK